MTTRSHSRARSNEKRKVAQRRARKTRAAEPAEVTHTTMSAAQAAQRLVNAGTCSPAILDASIRDPRSRDR